MVAALQRIWRQTASHLRWSAWAERKDIAAETEHCIGKFRADYSPLSPAELNQTEAAAEELLRRSKVVSAKRGL